MEKIIAVTFDIADQKCKMYNALEWHNFIADTREYLADGGEPVVMKAELVAQVQNAIGRELPSLNKMTKVDLQFMIDALVG